MESDLVKQMVTKDGTQRISFYRDTYADNPRYLTDEPLHCEDWNGDYSIMTKLDWIISEAGFNAEDLKEAA